MIEFWRKHLQINQNICVLYSILCNKNFCILYGSCGYGVYLEIDIQCMKMLRTERKYIINGGAVFPFSLNQLSQRTRCVERKKKFVDRRIRKDLLDLALKKAANSIKDDICLLF
jgi:hypothetical protein